MKKKKKEKPLFDHSYQISLADAAWYIYAFLRQPQLYKLATECAIGGTIFKEHVRPEAPLKYFGTMVWLCRNKDGGEFPPLFLTFEDGIYDPADVPGLPLKSELWYPNHTFKFSGVLSEERVRQMLNNDKYDLESDEEISASKLVDFINDLPKDPIGRPFNTYPCCFFENRLAPNEMDHFLDDNPELVAVRYYFGYDDSDKYHCLSNRIRVIFIGVDSDGRNIPPTVAIDVKSLAMFQNSWPPPPPY